MFRVPRTGDLTSSIRVLKITPLILTYNSCIAIFFACYRGHLGPNLAAQNRESRIARLPESQAWNRQKFRSKKQKNESNRRKVESRKIDSESPSESHPSNAQSDLGIARFESHDSESLDSRFRIADSVPLRARKRAQSPQENPKMGSPGSKKVAKESKKSPKIGNANLFTKCWFTIFVPLDTPPLPTSKERDFLLNFY